MTFSEKLGTYITQLDTTYTAFAREAGLSVSSVSHYARGEREPGYDSEELEKLAGGIAALSAGRGAPLDRETVKTELADTLKNRLDVPYEVFITNLNALLALLDVRGTQLARALSYDPSYISKLLSGGRRPGNLAEFITQTADYLARRCTRERDILAAAGLMGCEEREIVELSDRRDVMRRWLGSHVGPTEDDDPVSRFLEKLEEFNLDDFIRSIHFDEIRIPTVPFQLQTTRVYYGIQEMMESELDFMKATVMSRTGEDCILYSDMPMEEMADDPDFPRKWMLGRAMMLKKGLRLHVIHDVDRPFPELMLGLESYIPMYMTGQIMPYYLPTPQNDVFTHLLNVSGAAALEGVAIAGHQGDGKYTLYKGKEEVRHYRRRAEELLQKAQPLMEIYRSDRQQEFTLRLRKLWRQGDRRIVHASLPLFTIQEEVLDTLLERNGVSGEEAAAIRSYRRESRRDAEELIRRSQVTLVAPSISRELFDAAPLHLALSELFYEKDIPYDYETYRAHLENTRAWAKEHPSFTLELDQAPAFRHISYTVIPGQEVLVSKNKSPIIHFVIRHKKLVQAFQRFIPPIRDEI